MGAPTAEHDQRFSLPAGRRPHMGFIGRKRVQTTNSQPCGRPVKIGPKQSFHGRVPADQNCASDVGTPEASLVSQFKRDLIRLEDRRRALMLLGGACVIGLSGCSRELATTQNGQRRGPPPGEMAPMRSYPDVTAIAADGTTCVAFPGETEGPYPADGRGRGTVTSVLGGAALQRTDIRTSFGNFSGAAQGLPLQLTLTVVDVDNGCAPLEGRAVYLWHCNAAGQYSLYDLPQQNYLRGLQVSDAQGRVTFTTIYPGCYDGRFPHIHFEVFESAARATHGREATLTSQLALPAETDAQVYALAQYQGSSANLARVSLERDNVFGDNTAAQVAAQMLRMSGSPNAGYRALATVGLTATY